MKALVCFLLAGAVAIFSTLPFASAQVSNGMLRGFAVTDDETNPMPTVEGHLIFRIDLTNPNGTTVVRGDTHVTQQIEGLASIDDHTVVGRSNLFGVAESPDGTGLGGDSILADLTAAAVNSSADGVEVGETNVNFGTEAGAAWDPISGKLYAIYSDDRTIDNPDNDIDSDGDIECGTGDEEGQDFPATKIVVLDPTDGSVLEDLCLNCFGNWNNGLHLDGLAVGHDGTLYGVDARNTDKLYKFNFDDCLWEEIGPLLAENFSEDSGLATYRGVNDDSTTLYMITEGDGPSRDARLWRVCHEAIGGTCAAGQALPVNGADGNNNITLPGAVPAPEDLEGFDIPFKPLVGEQ
jgi:hypothetical protein